MHKVGEIEGKDKVGSQDSYDQIGPHVISPMILETSRSLTIRGSFRSRLSVAGCATNNCEQSRRITPSRWSAYILERAHAVNSLRNSAEKGLKTSSFLATGSPRFFCKMDRVVIDFILVFFILLG